MPCPSTVQNISDIGLKARSLIFVVLSKTIWTIPNQFGKIRFLKVDFMEEMPKIL